MNEHPAIATQTRTGDTPAGTIIANRKGISA